MSTVDRELRYWSRRLAEAREQVAEALADEITAWFAVHAWVNRKAEEHDAEQPGRII